MNIKNSLTTLALTGAFLATAGTTVAAGSSQCQIVYGGGEVCEENIQFTIDKKVLSPNKGGDFVDNLTINNERFQPGTQATFKIIVKNTGSKKINTLQVVDTLPQHLNFVSGPGTYNASNRTITYTINNLDKGATNEQTFIVSLANQKDLPSNQGIVCVTNHAQATADTGATAKDTAGLCIQNNVPTTPVKPTTPQVQTTLPPKSVPNTGPEMLPLLGLIPAGITGFILRKKSKLN